MKRVYEILRDERKRQNIKQAKLSELAGVTQPRISKFEKGEEVTLSTADHIASALGMVLTAVPKKQIGNIELITQIPITTPAEQSDDLLERYEIKDDE